MLMLKTLYNTKLGVFEVDIKDIVKFINAQYEFIFELIYASRTVRGVIRILTNVCDGASLQK